MEDKIDCCSSEICYSTENFIKNKGIIEAFQHFKIVKTQAESESGEKLKCFRTDRGGEFNSEEFGYYCDKNGIKRHLTAPYSPQ